MNKIYPYIGVHDIGCVVLFLSYHRGICLEGKTAHKLLETRDDWNEEGFKRCTYFGRPEYKKEIR